MSLKLNTASGGSITLQEADTASNLTITVPAVTGTMATVDGSGNMSVTGNLSFNSGYGSSATAYGCRAWVNFNGQSTPSIRASGNVSSITDDGTGKYRVNFTTAMPDANYAIVIATEESGTTCFTSQDNTYQQTSSSAYVKCLVGISDTGYDPEQFNVTIFR